MSRAGGARMAASPGARGRWITRDVYRGPVKVASPSHNEVKHCNAKR
jgi:hypothetical protein